jgi:hypothetical protein
MALCDQLKVALLEREDMRRSLLEAAIQEALK